VGDTADVTADPVTVTRRVSNAPRTWRFVLLALLAGDLFLYDRSVHRLWVWWLLYPGVAAGALVALYVVTHTSLTYSPTLLTKRLAFRERRLDLTQLVTAGVIVSGRYGQSGTIIGLYLEDRHGTRMTLSVARPYPNAPQWAGYVHAALEGSDADIGDRVMSTLEQLASAV
jgi:hypothetical protein